MKKIMVLGAGIYQVPLIKKAKQMGLYTIVVSIDGNYPGINIADKFVNLDTTNIAEVCKCAEREKIDAIAVCGTDVCVPTQGYVCDRLSLKGPTYKAAIMSQDKREMKRAFIEKGVRTAEAVSVDLYNSNPIDICEKLGYPVIFKSVDSSGSRGITVVNSQKDIKHAFEEVCKNTNKNYYLIEKYLIGTEFGAQAFIYDGQIKFVLPHGDYVFKGETGVPIGHYAPFDISQDIEKDLINQLKLAISALDINNCAINADFILCNGKTYVLEIGARAGATCLVEMVSLFYGFDYYEKIINASLGIEPTFDNNSFCNQPNAEMILKSNKNGIINSIKYSHSFDKRIVDFKIDYKIGDAIRKFKKGPDRIGHIIAIGDSIAEAKRVIDDYLESVVIEVDGENCIF